MAFKRSRAKRTRSRISKRRFKPRRKFSRRRPSGMARRVNQLYNMIETKENAWHSASNQHLAHNNVWVVNNSLGVPLNPFALSVGPADAQGANGGQRVGDRITIKGLLIKVFLENAIGRSKVWYRLMVVKAAHGDTIDRTTLFKGEANNKMLDQVNTERFSIVAQRILTVVPSNAQAGALDAISGAPEPGSVGGQASRIVSIWIPGRRICRGGNLQYMNNDVNPKFFDYRIVIAAYDWYGTPQDVNNVGNINELYTKLYFKDA